MHKYTPPKAIFCYDGEYGSTECDAAIIDGGIVAYILNPDGLTYTLKHWWHNLIGIEHRDAARSMSRRTIDWWFKDARSDWNPEAGAQAYIKRIGNVHAMRMGGGDTLEHMLLQSQFVSKVLRDENVGRTDFVLCAKGPDIDFTIANHAFAMYGIDFNYHFARYSSLRDIEKALGAFAGAGFRYVHESRTDCPIPFVDKDYYLNNPSDGKGMPPAVKHVGLYDAWLEGSDAVEYYTILNHLNRNQLGPIRG